MARCQAETPDGDLKSNQRLVVTKASGITKPSELIGKKIGVGASQLSKVTAQAWLEKAEVDPDKVIFEIVAQPQALPNLLKTGEVAAVVVSDPAIQQLDQEVGINVLGWPSDVVPPKSTYTGLFSTSEFADKNPDLVKRYVRAYRRGAAYFNQASAAEKARIVKLAGLDLQALSAKYPNLVEEFRYNKASDQPSDIAATQGWVDTGVRFGGVPKAVDIAPFVFVTARENVR